MKTTWMFRLPQIILVLALISLVAACGQNQADPNSALAKDSIFSPKPVAKVMIPQGTRLRIALINGVSTTKSSPGDEFMASITEPVIVDGKTVLEKGTKVRGKVTDVQESGRVKGRASIRMVLTDIVRDGGKTVSISTKPFIAVAENTKKRDATVIGGGTGIGALIGGIAGGGKGAAIGAAVGAGAGTGTVLATKGKDLNYRPETKLSFTLANSVEM
jgi:hypothetical protein